MYNTFSAVGFIVLIATCSVFTEAVNKTSEERAIASVENLIQTSQAIIPIAKLVRLAFHDCVGGCDGCLNLNNPDNAGLRRIYNEINSIYNANFSSIMSRADFVALAGVIGIRQGSLRQSCRALNLPANCVKPMPNITIRYGRRDCATSPITNAIHKFPNPHGNLLHVLDFFGNGMNMTNREVVALLGAHSLGQATLRNSGFDGPWAIPMDRFDNGFYRELVTNGWVQDEVNDTMSAVYPNVRYQWNRVNLFMLNSDMSLFKLIRPDSSGEETNQTCRELNTNCPPAMTADIVTEFATDNSAFFTSFAPAFTKLIENGYNSTELSIATSSSASLSALLVITVIALIISMI